MTLHGEVLSLGFYFTIDRNVWKDLVHSQNGVNSFFILIFFIIIVVLLCVNMKVVRIILSISFIYWAPCALQILSSVKRASAGAGLLICIAGIQSLGGRCG